jgi:Flp pilus assembly pilin Flp
VDRSGGERGATAVAYAIMVAIIAVVLVSGIFVLGDSIKAVFDGGADCVTSPSDCGGAGSGNPGGGNPGGGNPGSTTTTRPASTTTSTTIAAATAP